MVVRSWLRDLFFKPGKRNQHRSWRAARVAPAEVSVAERLEDRELLTAFTPIAANNEALFVVYQDVGATSQGSLPGNAFAGGEGISPGRQGELRSLVGTSHPVEAGRGTVAEITLPPVAFTEFVGINFKGGLHDLRGAYQVVFDARSPTNGGVDIKWGVDLQNTDQNALFRVTEADLRARIARHV